MMRVAYIGGALPNDEVLHAARMQNLRLEHVGGFPGAKALGKFDGVLFETPCVLSAVRLSKTHVICSFERGAIVIADMRTPHVRVLEHRWTQLDGLVMVRRTNFAVSVGNTTVAKFDDDKATCHVYANKLALELRTYVEILPSTGFWICGEKR